MGIAILNKHGWMSGSRRPATLLMYPPVVLALVVLKNVISSSRIVESLGLNTRLQKGLGCNYRTVWCFLTIVWSPKKTHRIFLNNLTNIGSYIYCSISQESSEYGAPLHNTTPCRQCVETSLQVNQIACSYAQPSEIHTLWTRDFPMMATLAALFRNWPKPMVAA